MADAATVGFFAEFFHPLLLTGLTAFALAAFFVPLFARLSTLLGWVDRPGGLKSHETPIPYGGGLAIVSAAFLALFFWYIRDWPPFFLELALGSLVIAAGGFWDDLYPMGFRAKFGVQILGALISIAFGIHLNIKIFPEFINLALTVLWLLGITNAFNLIDIIDGLAAGIAGIAALTFGLISFMFGDIFPAFLGFSICGAATGFLIFNFKPARVFMGDAGAQFLGFLLGNLAIIVAYTTYNPIALLAPLLVLGIPIFDTALVIIIRLSKKQSPFMGSPDHLPIRLRRLGFSVPHTVRILLLATLFLSFAATMATLVPLDTALLIYAIVIVSSTVFGLWIAGVDISDREPIDKPGPFVIGFTGSIGAGKSTFSRMVEEELEQMGITCRLVSADKVVHELFTSNDPTGAPPVVLAELAKEFGEDILNEDRTLNKNLLAERAFASVETAERINSIIHPHVIAKSREIINSCGKATVILDVPLLFESGMNRLCAYTVVVTAPEKIRRERYEGKDFDKRDPLQWSQEKKTKLADSDCSNDGTIEELNAQARALVRNILSLNDTLLRFPLQT